MENSLTFDLVIPYHKKDMETLSLCVEYARKNIKGLDRIFLLGKEPGRIEGTIFASESAFDRIYTKARIHTIWHDHYPAKARRAGWIYQQFLKLGAWKCIDGLSENYLCLDSDTLFLRPVHFLEETHRFLYLVASEYHKPYLETYERLMKEKAAAGFSFIAHHMMFNQEILKALFKHIEALHGMPWGDAIMQSLDFTQGSNFSEWDLYGNWVLKTQSEIARNRPLEWENISYIPDPDQADDLTRDYHFVSAHAWKRVGRRKVARE